MLWLHLHFLCFALLWFCVSAMICKWFVLVVGFGDCPFFSCFPMFVNFMSFCFIFLFCFFCLSFTVRDGPREKVTLTTILSRHNACKQWPKMRLSLVRCYFDKTNHCISSFRSSGVVMLPIHSRICASVQCNNLLEINYQSVICRFYLVELPFIFRFYCPSDCV